MHSSVYPLILILLLLGCERINIFFGTDKRKEQADMSGLVWTTYQKLYIGMDLSLRYSRRP